VPNDIVVYLSPSDHERFANHTDVLQRELADAAREHARDEAYSFLGPVTVALIEDDELRTGQLEVVAEIVEGKATHLGALVLPDGRRVQLGDEPATIGRLPDCTVSLTDPQASRRHAEVRPSGDGFVVTDLGSMNGTTVNGVAIHEQRLQDGDEIGVGSTTIRFEAS
jgi:FHA domain/FhaA, N-terminal domain